MSKLLFRNYFQTKKISLKLVVWTLLFSAMITLIITMIQLYMDYKNGLKSIESQFTLIEKSYKPLLTESIWVLDSTQINLQLNSLLHLPDIEYAKVDFTDGTFLEVGNTALRLKQERRFDLHYHHHNQTTPIGALLVHADLNNLYTYLKNKVIVILLSQGIKTFIVSFFILFLMQRLVTRHLSKIANYLLHLDSTRLDSHLTLSKERSTPPDELDQVTIAINNMQDILKNSFESLSSELSRNEEITQYLQTSENNLQEAQKIAKLGCWEWNEETQKLQGSIEFFRILEQETTEDLFLGEKDFTCLMERFPKAQFLKKLNHQDFSALQNNKIYPLHNIDGSVTYIKNHFQKIESENGQKKYIGTIQDITQEYLITMQNKELLSSMQQSPINILICNNQGIIEYINAKALQTFALQHDDVIGQPLTVLGEDNIDYSEVFAQVLQTGIWQQEVHKKDRHDKLLIFETLITPITNSSNSEVKFSIWKEDITQKKGLEEKLLIQSKHAQMGEMISMIAHQWRQPLSNITTMMSNARVKDELDILQKEDLEKLVSDVQKQIKYLTTTINDFRNFFKPNKEMEHFFVSDIISNIHLILGTLITENDITLTHSELEKISIYSYKGELLQVVINLVKNSIDAFMEHTIADPTITINHKLKEDSFVLSLTDNAGGIPKDILDNIFVPYFSTKEQRNGTGLGLYMSKIIIEKHMFGKLDVVSENGTTTFQIILPLSIVEQKA